MPKNKRVFPPAALLIITLRQASSDNRKQVQNLHATPGTPLIFLQAVCETVPGDQQQLLKLCLIFVKGSVPQARRYTCFLALLMPKWSRVFIRLELHIGELRLVVCIYC